MGALYVSSVAPLDELWWAGVLQVGSHSCSGASELLHQGAPAAAASSQAQRPQSQSILHRLDAAHAAQDALQQVHASHDAFQATQDMLARLHDPYTRVIATTMTSAWQARTTGQVLHVGLGIRDVQVHLCL